MSAIDNVLKYNLDKSPLPPIFHTSQQSIPMKIGVFCVGWLQNAQMECMQQFLCVFRVYIQICLACLPLDCEETTLSRIPIRFGKDDRMCLEFGRTQAPSSRSLFTESPRSFTVTTVFHVCRCISNHHTTNSLRGMHPNIARLQSDKIYFNYTLLSLDYMNNVRIYVFFKCRHFILSSTNSLVSGEGKSLRLKKNKL